MMKTRNKNKESGYALVTVLVALVIATLALTVRWQSGQRNDSLSPALSETEKMRLEALSLLQNFRDQAQASIQSVVVTSATVVNLPGYDSDDPARKLNTFDVLLEDLNGRGTKSVRYSLTCLGQGSGAGFAEGTCTSSRMVTAFPKEYRASIQLSDSSYRGLEARVSARISFVPTQLGNFSMVLSNATQVVFGGGQTIDGLVSINLATPDPANPNPNNGVFFANANDDLKFLKGFSVNYPDMVKFKMRPAIAGESGPQVVGGPGQVQLLGGAGITTSQVSRDFRQAYTDILARESEHPSVQEFAKGSLNRTSLAPNQRLLAEISMGKIGGTCRARFDEIVETRWNGLAPYAGCTSTPRQLPSGSEEITIFDSTVQESKTFRMNQPGASCYMCLGRWGAACSFTEQAATRIWPTGTSSDGSPLPYAEIPADAANGKGFVMTTKAVVTALKPLDSDKNYIEVCDDQPTSIIASRGGEIAPKASIVQSSLFDESRPGIPVGDPVSDGKKMALSIAVVDNAPAFDWDAYMAQCDEGGPCADERTIDLSSNSAVALKIEVDTKLLANSGGSPAASNGTTVGAARLNSTFSPSTDQASFRVDAFALSLLPNAGKAMAFGSVPFEGNDILTPPAGRTTFSLGKLLTIGGSAAAKTSTSRTLGADGSIRSGFSAIDRRFVRGAAPGLSGVTTAVLQGYTSAVSVQVTPVGDLLSRFDLAWNVPEDVPVDTPTSGGGCGGESYDFGGGMPSQTCGAFIDAN